MQSVFPAIRLKKRVHFHGRMLASTTKLKQIIKDQYEPSWRHLKLTSVLLFLHRYGQSTWQNKDDCWGIQNHVCDLTNETSDIQEPYYGRVKAASAGVYSDWSLSCRFTPWRESKCKHMGPSEKGTGISVAWNVSFLLTVCKYE